MINTSVLKNNINDIMDTTFYHKADEAKGAAVWQRVEKNDKNIFEINKSPKIMMYKDFMICFSQEKETSSEVYYIIPRAAMRQNRNQVNISKEVKQSLDYSQ